MVGPVAEWGVGGLGAERLMSLGRRYDSHDDHCLCYPALAAG
jgi:hypothetical protein